MVPVTKAQKRQRIKKGSQVREVVSQGFTWDQPKLKLTVKRMKVGWKHGFT